MTTNCPFTLMFSGSDSRVYYEQAQQQLGVPFHDAGRERVMQTPAWFGVGSIRTITLREGVNLVITDMCPNETMIIAWRADQMSPFIELHFHLAGASFTTLAPTRQQYALQSGHVGCGYSASPELCGQIVYPARQRLTMIEVSMQPPALDTFGAPLDSLLPVPARRAQQAGFHMRESRMTPAMWAALYQVLHCPFSDVARQLYLEGKALELIGLYVADHGGAGQPQPGAALRPDDVERIHAAKDVLLHHMENPPTLPALARQVGINDHKLKVGFKQVFGTTVFGYLHTQRMEQARRLLLEGRLNVLEVACAVGYASPSRFTAAFKQRFGVLPSTMSHTARTASATAQKRSRSA